jgi:phospholipid transport system substrate-binding protein
MRNERPVRHQLRTRLLISMILSASVTPAALAASQATPSQVVQRLHEALIDDMKSARVMGYSARLKALRPVVDDVFDQEFAARKTIGLHWRELDRENQRRWVETFSRVTVASWVGRPRSHSGGHFEILGVSESPGGSAVVRTKLILPHDPDVELDYRLRRTQKGWQIVDVYTDGPASQLAALRARYSAILKRRGFESLVSSLELQMAALAETSQQPLAAAAIAH